MTGAERGALGAHLVPSLQGQIALREVAGGRRAGDLAIRGGIVPNLHTMEMLARDVVIVGEHIAAVVPPGELQADREVDASGLAVLPTFIDAHLHIEYTMLVPGELARLVVPRGTGAVIADPNCSAAVLGHEGLDVTASTQAPLRIFQQVSPKIPSCPGLELAGPEVPQGAVLERLGWERAASLGESDPFTLDEAATERYVTALSEGRRITGHTARSTSDVLWPYLAVGVSDDHNAVTSAEVLERLRLGLVVTIMAGSMNDNVADTFRDIAAIRPCFDRLCFCADDKHCLDLSRLGHVDHHVRTAIECGVDPLWAYRMATINAATYYRLDHVLGLVAPGRLADLQLIPQLEAARSALVIMGGRVVAEDGRANFENVDRFPPSVRDSVKLGSEFSPGSFRIEPSAGAPQAWVQAVEMYDGYFKRAFHALMAATEGNIEGDPARDIAKVAVVDRLRASGSVGLGFVRGLRLRRGAISTSTNCTNQNLVVAGTNDRDMYRAAREIERMGGGHVVVADGQTLASVPLPVSGVMSDRPWEEVVAAAQDAEAAARRLGCELTSPFMVLSFVGLAAVPDLGLTELGLIDVSTQSFRPVVLEWEGDRPRCACPHHRSPVHAAMDPVTAEGG